MITYSPIQAKDNEALSKVIKTALEEHDMAIDGTVYTDETTDRMSTCYTSANSRYIVVSDDGELLGGCGIAPVSKVEGYCELQRMFLKQSARGKGIAQSLLDECLNFAQEAGYTHVYLETAPKLKAAIRLYEKNHFQYIDHSLGDTGHHACQIWMVKKLAAI